VLARTLLVIAIVAGSLALGASPAAACSCAPLTKQAHAEHAALVFTGIVTDVTVHGAPLVMSSIDPVEVVFAVEKVYKGQVTKTTTVWTVREGASCGYRFEMGRRYTVFSHGWEGRFGASLCSGNVEGPIVADSYGLGVGSPPGADPFPWVRSAIVAGVILATTAFVAAARRGRRPGRPVSAA
jgi:hypothetical protein